MGAPLNSTSFGSIVSPIGAGATSAAPTKRLKRAGPAKPKKSIPVVPPLTQAAQVMRDEPQGALSRVRR